MKKCLIGILIFFAIYSCDKTEKVSTQNEQTNLNESIGQFSLKSLIDTGLTVEPYKYKVSKQFTKKFKNNEIPIKVCANFKRDGYGFVDSLMVEFNGKFHKIFIGENEYFMLDPVRMFTIESDIKLLDYNFDNLPDLAVYSTQSGMKNIMENVYIFNKGKNKYFKNRILSASSNCKIDSVNETISTFGQGGMASMIYGAETFKWENDKLKLIKSETQNYIDNINLFVRETKELVDTNWVVKVDTLSEEKILEMRDKK